MFIILANFVCVGQMMKLVGQIFQIDLFYLFKHQRQRA